MESDKNDPPLRMSLTKVFLVVHHRLNGSSSPVLTATCISCGSLCDFLTFFRNTPGGQTPQPIFAQNGSNDVDSRIDGPFAVKMETF